MTLELGATSSKKRGCKINDDVGRKGQLVVVGGEERAAEDADDQPTGRTGSFQFLYKEWPLFCFLHQLPPLSRSCLG